MHPTRGKGKREAGSFLLLPWWGSATLSGNLILRKHALSNPSPEYKRVHVCPEVTEYPAAAKVKQCGPNYTQKHVPLTRCWMREARLRTHTLCDSTDANTTPTARHSGAAQATDGGGLLAGRGRQGGFWGAGVFLMSVGDTGALRLCSATHHLWDPVDCSMSGLSVPHRLPKFAQVPLHCIGDAIQPSHPLPSPSPPALNLSQHQGLFQ